MTDLWSDFLYFSKEVLWVISDSQLLLPELHVKKAFVIGCLGQVPSHGKHLCQWLHITSAWLTVFPEKCLSYQWVIRHFEQLKLVSRQRYFLVCFSLLELILKGSVRDGLYLLLSEAYTVLLAGPRNILLKEPLQMLDVGLSLLYRLTTLLLLGQVLDERSKQELIISV